MAFLRRLIGTVETRRDLAQHEALGILGVNLVHGACRRATEADALLAGLLDDLDRNRIEIGMVEFSGEAYTNLDHRLTSLRLVELGLSTTTV